MKKKIKNTHQHCRNGKIVENWTFNTLTLYGHSVPVNKKSGWHFKKQGGGGRSCIRSIKRASVFFFFYHFHFQIEGGAAGKGNDGGRSTHHVRRTTAQYKKNFVDSVASFFSAEEQPLELPEQSKLRLEDTRGNISSVISPTTTQFLFFLLLFTGTQ